MRDNQDTKPPLSCATSDLVVSLKLSSDLFRQPSNQDDFVFDKQSASIPYYSFLVLVTDVARRLCPDAKAAMKTYRQNLQTKRDLEAGISAQRMPSDSSDGNDSDASTSTVEAKKHKLS